MAGLGIRTFELARVLARHADVTVAHGGRTAGDFEGVHTLPFRPHDPAALRAPIATADVVVAHPVWPLVAPLAAALAAPASCTTCTTPRRSRRSSCSQGADAVSPPAGPPHARSPARRAADRAPLHCASEKQRDLWLGAMLGQRLIDPRLYDRDPSLRSVIDTVPFGVPAEPPAAPPAGARARASGSPRSVPTPSWCSGTAGSGTGSTHRRRLRAVAELARRRPRLRLLFMGAASRDAADAATERTRALAADLGVLDRVVLFHDGWVPYEERALWLRQADCAISTHARACRGPVRVPHAHARLLLERAARRLLRRRRARRARRARRPRRGRAAGRPRSARRRARARARPRPSAYADGCGAPPPNTPGRRRPPPRALGHRPRRRCTTGRGSAARSRARRGIAPARRPTCLGGRLLLDRRGRR